MRQWEYLEEGVPKPPVSLWAPPLLRKSAGNFTPTDCGIIKKSPVCAPGWTLQYVRGICIPGTAVVAVWYLVKSDVKHLYKLHNKVVAKLSKSSTANLKAGVRIPALSRPLPLFIFHFFSRPMTTQLSSILGPDHLFPPVETNYLR